MSLDFLSCMVSVKLLQTYHICEKVRLVQVLQVQQVGIWEKFVRSETVQYGVHTGDEHNSTGWITSQMGKEAAHQNLMSESKVAALLQPEPLD